MREIVTIRNDASFQRGVDMGTELFLDSPRIEKTLALPGPSVPDDPRDDARDVRARGRVRRAPHPALRERLRGCLARSRRAGRLGDGVQHDRADGALDALLGPQLGTGPGDGGGDESARAATACALLVRCDPGQAASSGCR